jgi:hypothetical protein
MKILEPRGFSEFRLPATDLDFRRSPGKFDRNLPESLRHLTSLQGEISESDLAIAERTVDLVLQIDKKGDRPRVFPVRASTYRRRRLPSHG